MGSCCGKSEVRQRRRTESDGRSGYHPPPVTDPPYTPSTAVAAAGTSNIGKYVPQVEKEREGESEREEGFRCSTLVCSCCSVRLGGRHSLQGPEPESEVHGTNS